MYFNSKARKVNIFVTSLLFCDDPIPDLTDYIAREKLTHHSVVQK